LFVLKNNRTIREPQVFREGRKGYCPHTLFWGAFTGGTGNWRGFLHRRLRGPGTQWVKQL